MDSQKINVMKLIKCKIKIQDREESERAELMGLENIAPEFEYTYAYINVDHITMFFPTEDKWTGEKIISVHFLDGDGTSVYEPMHSFLDKITQ